MLLNAYFQPGMYLNHTGANYVKVFVYNENQVSVVYFFYLVTKRLMFLGTFLTDACAKYAESLW